MASLPILGASCLGWGPAFAVWWSIHVPALLAWPGHCRTLCPCQGGHCPCPPCHHPTSWMPFLCRPPLTLAALTLNYFHDLVLLLWEERFFCSGDQVCHCSFLTRKPRFAHSIEEQQEGSWARSLDLGGVCREAWQLGSTLELFLWQLLTSPILDLFCQYQPGKYLSKWNPDGSFWVCNWTR